MKPKHLQIRIEQCLALSKASNCPRRKFGALLIDPERNVVLMDGYNGGPRGGQGDLCAGAFCARDGVKREDFAVRRARQTKWVGGQPGRIGGVHPVDEHYMEITLNGAEVHRIPFHEILDQIVKTWDEDPSRLALFRKMDGSPAVTERPETPEDKAEAWIAEMVAKYPGVPSGTHMEVGCHHAEMNVICNAAASGVRTKGGWLLITGEPCVLCSKLIHHAGIAKVIVVGGGYAGENGLDYLRTHNVEVESVAGPPDPRSQISAS